MKNGAPRDELKNGRGVVGPSLKRVMYLVIIIAETRLLAGRRRNESG